MFNVNEVYQLMKLSQEEVERRTQNAWKMEDFRKDTILQKLVKKLTSKPQLTIDKTNCDYVCCC
ncbi:hypothetical protein [Neobacillus sp. DY30]|uniref:hypothetical protein n=1 Tax=Neobacillus sp. DY30 TaxID=3047871 RepID=UPI0024BF2A69|nr:hypothetical protein [Neobacillus sp. DY30]WHY03257.1 hypothetical protein QNH29_13990 [Neobacillus sp. DY30]